MMPDVMLDLESCGTRPSAPIFAIGAVTFDMQTLELGERYYMTVDMGSCVADGAVIEPDTVYWWLQQSEQARVGITRGSRMDIRLALADFADWLRQHSGPESATRMWGNGSGFDCVILRAHYERAGVTPPWEWWNDRDFRTLKALYPNVERDEVKGVAHNALDDAIAQVEHIFKIRRTLRGAK